MIRWLLFIAVAAVLAWIAGWLARSPGQVTLEWLGYHIETSVGILILGILILVAVLVVLFRLLSALMGTPKAWVRRYRGHRQRRGYRALSRGLVAVAAGDANGAHKQAGRASSLLDDRPLTLLLSAQAAQMHGDDKQAAQYFQAMRERPATEFLGLRGLLTQAMKRQDWAEAHKLALNAYRLNPKSEWVVSTLYDLQRRLGRWTDAEETLDQKVRLKLIASQDASRERADLLCHQSEEDADARLRWAGRAFKADPAYSPAAIRYADVLIAEGLEGRAAAAIEQAWAANPVPELADLYWRARRCDDAEGKLQAAHKLAKRNPDHLESRLAVATAALEARQWGEVRKALAPVASEDAPPRVCRLMAELEEAEHGDLARARSWLLRATHGDAHTTIPAQIAPTASAVTIHSGG
jgi:HemY protein